MKQLTLDYPPLYPINRWQICEDFFSPDHMMLSETVFALGNGYIGIRGSFEEGLSQNTKRTIDGIYLNGFYESVPIPHAERGYGYALNTQTMLNVTDSKIIELYLEYERFSLDSGTVLRFKRTLDLRKGYLTRQVTWRSPLGKEVEIEATRMVSFSKKHVLAFQYKVKPLNFSGPVTINSAINGAVDNHTHEEEDPRFSASLGGLGLTTTGIMTEANGAVLTQETRRSNLSLACAMENKVIGSQSAEIVREQTGQQAVIRFRFNAAEERWIGLEKFVSYYTSLDYPQPDLPRLAKETAAREREKGFNCLIEEQEKVLENYWEDVGLKIEGDLKLEQGLRFNLFQILQAAGSEGRTGIAAKGLTSEGYDGHYFWDTEIYMIPFFSAVMPEQARSLLKYRYSILDHARSRAVDLSHNKGALYPWRTIAGEEGSSYYPAGTAQYHINAAIAYAISKYVEITGDYSFMLEYGAEIIFETARLWEDLGAYIPSKGNCFCYNEVTGPDEYTALVNNNCYTNLMARWHMCYAAQTARHIQKKYPAKYQRLSDKISLKVKEIEAWEKAASVMYIPYDQKLQVHPQDDSFFDKEIWDFKNTPPEKYPLLLHYHPLVIYRFQVCKQPDIILGQLLLGEQFSQEQKRRDYQYYEPITTHDSSLSPSIFSVAASELGYYKDADYFFRLAARLDLDNVFGDTHYGVHMANMAGSWLCLVHGFGGMRTDEGGLKFNPYLPEGWKCYNFKIVYKNCRIAVEVKPETVTYSNLQGGPVKFEHAGTKVSLVEGEKITCKIKKLKIKQIKG